MKNGAGDGHYRVLCTLTFGDIYPQVLAWMEVIFASLATALGLMGASQPLFALRCGLDFGVVAAVLLFAFTTTLLNHIALEPQATQNAAEL